MQNTYTAGKRTKYNACKRDVSELLSCIVLQIRGWPHDACTHEAQHGASINMVSWLDMCAHTVHGCSTRGAFPHGCLLVCFTRTVDRR
eukprot:5148766-Amphidinium_carterae.1